MSDEAKQVLTIENRTGQQVTYTVTPIVDERRFGERLRAWLRNDWLDIKATDDAGLRDIADAIDQDERWAAEAACAAERQEHGADLRRKIEQLVEKLRFVVQGDSASGPTIDHLDADDFLSHLDTLFGEGG
jgi:hypothetical protein